MPGLGHRRRLPAQLRDLLGQLVEAEARGLVLCHVLLEGLELDLDLDHRAIDGLYGLGLGEDLHPPRGGGLVHDVDGLVGQHPIGQVAVGEANSGAERGVGDPDSVVQLVAVLEPAQDRDALLGRGLLAGHELKAPDEGRVALDPLAVFGEGRGANAAQLPAREGRLEEVRGVEAALLSAGPDQGVDLVDEDDRVLGGAGLLDDLLEPLLELAAELGARHEAPHVEGEEGRRAEVVGDVAVGDPEREAFDEGGLTDARLADDHRVVLGSPRERLNQLADLGVATEHAVEVALGGLLGQIDGVFREGLELGLAWLAICVSADACFEEHEVDPSACQGPSYRWVRDQGQQEVARAAALGRRLDADLLGAVQDRGQGGIDLRLRSVSLGQFGDELDQSPGRGHDLGRVSSGEGDLTLGRGAQLIEEGQQEVSGRDRGAAQLLTGSACVLDQ